MDFDIDYQKLSLYLEKKGFKKLQTNRGGIDAYVENAEHNPLEFFAVNRSDAPDFKASMRMIIGVLAEHEDVEPQRMLQKVKSIDYDLHHYRIGIEKVEDVSVLLLNQLLEAAKISLRESARIEHRDDYEHSKGEVNSPRVESEHFLSQCRFAHTWKGSFGITIESPIGIPTVGMFQDIPDTLGRKTSKRVLNILKTVEVAEEKDSYQYLVDHVHSNSDLAVVAGFPSILEFIQHEEITFSMDFSPQIPSSPEMGGVQSKIISRKSLVIIEKAIEQTLVRDEEFDTVILGFPEMLKAKREDLVQGSLLEGERTVTVRGISNGVEGPFSLRMDLSLDDYHKALKAQEENKNVSVKCRIKKKNRGWEMVAFYSFELG